MCVLSLYKCKEIQPVTEIWPNIILYQRIEFRTKWVMTHSVRYSHGHQWHNAEL